MGHHEKHLRLHTVHRAAKLACLVGVAAIGGGAAAADVAGRDWKGYAGVNCMTQEDVGLIRRSAENQIAFSNLGTSTLLVFCPVVRDDPGAGNPRVAGVAVRFRNRNAAVTGRCEFSSHDQNGLKIDTKSAVAPFGETTLQLGPLNGASWGSYVLQCQLPGRDSVTGLPSYIVNYRVDEVSP
jgi:hypothetical protein